jgi:O-antigen/teichoic acid export membrane protein
MIKAYLNYSLSVAINVAAGFVTIYFLSTHLTLEEYGQVGIFLSVVSLLTYGSTMCSTGLVGIKMRLCNKVEFNDFINAYRSILLLLGFISFFILCVVSTITKWFSIYFVILASLYTASQVQWAITSQTFIHSNKSFEYLKISGLITIITLLLSYILIVQVDAGAEGRFIAMIMGGLIPLLAFRLLDIKKISLIPNQIIANEVVSFGWPLLIGSGAGWVLYSLDKVLILNIFGMDSVGVYTYAVSLASLFAYGTSSVNNIFVPKLYAELKQLVDSTVPLKKVILNWAMLILGITLLTYVVIYVFFQYIGGEKYKQYMTEISLVVIGYSILPFANIFGSILEYKRENIMRTKIYYLAAAVYVLVILSLYSYFGLSSVAIALCIAHIILLILNIFFSLRSLYYPSKFNIKGRA